MYRLFGFLLLVSAAYGQLHLQGACDLTNVPIQQNLIFTEMLGTWYQVARINNTFDQGDCGSITFSLQNVSNTPVVYVTTQEVVNNQLVVRNGTLDITAQGLNATYTDGSSLVFVILKTDYTGYAVIYSCSDETNGKSVLAWQYSRATTPSAASTASMLSVIRQTPDLVNATWIKSSHTGDACIINAAAKVSSVIALLFIGLFVTKQI